MGRVVHSLLSYHGWAGIAILVGNLASCSVLIWYHEMFRAGRHHLRLTLAHFGLVFVCVLQKLQSIAYLRLVETVWIICWLGSAGYRLLWGSCWWLIWGIIAALRLIECSLFVVIRLNTPRFLIVSFWNVALALLLLSVLLLVQVLLGLVGLIIKRLCLRIW